MSARTPLRFPRTLSAALMLGSMTSAAPLVAQGGPPQGENAGGGRVQWDVTQARGQTRDIDFTTSEGTWMSADLSPDRTWIVFDLLGHVYRMPAAGGEATALTQTSGVALNFQPRISPDGKTIAFITRSTRPVQPLGHERRRLESASGVHRSQRDGARAGVDARRQLHRREEGWTRRRRRRRASGGIWMYHKDGGQGVQIIGRRPAVAVEAAVAAAQRRADVADRVGRRKLPVLPGVDDGRRQAAALGLDAASPLRVQDRRDRRRHRRREQRRGGGTLLERRRRGARDLARRTLARVRAPDSRRHCSSSRDTSTVRARRSGFAT